MADPRFFTRAVSRTVADLAELTGSKIIGDGADSILIEDVASLSDAREGHISFLDNAKYKEQFTQTRASACFVSDRLVNLAPKGVICLVNDNPYKSYALTAQAFYPSEFPKSCISPHAFVDETAIISDGCVIEAGAVIKANAEIGRGTYIESGAVIGESVRLGEKCWIGANASVSHSLIGDYVRLYPGVRCGQDGFGFAIDPAGHVKVPQLGRVVIEDHVEIGANTTIDRGAGPDTIIGQGCWIDNLVQIGHNVKLGRGCVMVSQSGVSGSSELGDFVVVAGQVGIAGHLKIGSGARIAAKTGVMKDIAPGEEVMGYPSVPVRQYMKQVALLQKMVKRNKNGE